MSMPKEPCPSQANATPHAAEDPSDHAQAIVDKWERYVSEQQEKRVQAAAEVQDIMDASGLSARGVDPTDPAFAELSLDLEFQRQISLHFGLKLDKATPVDPSKPDVSRWRQRTRALKV
jgi:hypothetical protein